MIDISEKSEVRPPFCTIPEALEEIRAGRMIVVLDDPDRENEGDLTMAAEKVTPEAINFMAAHGRGLICAPITAERAEELGLEPMVPPAQNTSANTTAFTVSVEARNRVTTGISAYDRAATVLALTEDGTRPEDLLRPGHTFPLIAAAGGVLKRAGQTEAAVDLARMAGLKPAGVVCEVMDDDGHMARGGRLQDFALKHGLKMVTVEDLLRYRMRNERLVHRIAQPRLKNEFGEFRLIAYASDIEKETHLALVMGEVDPDVPVLVRVHSECLTGDVFGSQRCDCGAQLREAMRMIGEEGRGVVLYLRQEGRGIGLSDKLRAYELQEQGHDTVEANEALGYPPDMRDYGIGAQILKDLGVAKLRHMTNNPHKFVAIRGYGLEIVERVPIEIPTKDPDALRYLRTKKEKLGHLITDV